MFYCCCQGMHIVVWDSITYLHMCVYMWKNAIHLHINGIWSSSDEHMALFSEFRWIQHIRSLGCLSLHFNGHFPGEPGFASVHWSKRMMESMVTTGAMSRAKLQSNHHYQQTNIQFFTRRMPRFLSPNQQCQSTDGKSITFHGLDHPKLTWGLPTLSMTTDSSWLPWGGLPCLSSALSCPKAPAECYINQRFTLH